MYAVLALEDDKLSKTGSMTPVGILLGKSISLTLKLSKVETLGIAKFILASIGLNLPLVGFSANVPIFFGPPIKYRNFAWNSL